MDKTEVLELAELSGLEVGEAEAEDFAAEISGVLRMIDNIREFEKNDSFIQEAMELSRLRRDEAADSDLSDKITEERDGRFTVPKVI